MSERSEAVLAFWFGTLAGDDAPPSAEHQKRWWSGSASDDAEVRARFGRDHDDATQGLIEHWAATPRGRLALVIVLDQFSRSLGRGSGAAFAQDETAQRHVAEACAQGQDVRLRPIERAFLYMPLMHSERPELHAEAARRFEALHASCGPAVEGTLAGFVRSAQQHRAVIDRFGRYPHRNERLGRASTAEELAFLAQPGSSFG